MSDSELLTEVLAISLALLREGGREMILCGIENNRDANCAWHTLTPEKRAEYLKDAEALEDYIALFRCEVKRWDP